MEPHLGRSWPLSASILARSSYRWNYLVRPGWSPRCRRAAGRSDITGLLERFARLRAKAQARTGKTFPVIVIQEAGLDGFWIHRVLENEGIESHVVDAASILISRRRRRAKTRRSDGETLVRTLHAYKRGEPRV